MKSYPNHRRRWIIILMVAAAGILAGLTNSSSASATPYTPSGDAGAVQGQTDSVGLLPQGSSAPAASNASATVDADDSKQAVSDPELVVDLTPQDVVVPFSLQGFDPSKANGLEPAHVYVTQVCINQMALVGVGYEYTDYHDGGIRDKCRPQYERSFSVAIYWRLITDFPSNGTIYNLIKSYPKYVEEFEETLGPAWMLMAYFNWQEGPYNWNLGACMYEHHDGTLYLITPSLRRGSDGYPYHAATIRRVEKSEMATIYQTQVNCNN